MHDDTAPPLRESEFGLWLKHKAPVFFEGLPELDQVFRYGNVEFFAIKAESALQQAICESEDMRLRIRSIVRIRHFISRPLRLGRPACLRIAALGVQNGDSAMAGSRPDRIRRQEHR